MQLTAEEKKTDQAKMLTYEDKLGFFITPDMLLDYHILQKSVGTYLLQIENLQEVNDRLNISFNQMATEYYQLKRKQAIYIGVTVGSCCITLAILAGIITFCALKANNIPY